MYYFASILIIFTHQKLYQHILSVIVLLKALNSFVVRVLANIIQLILSWKLVNKPTLSNMDNNISLCKL